PRFGLDGGRRARRRAGCGPAAVSRLSRRSYPNAVLLYRSCIAIRFCTFVRWALYLRVAWFPASGEGDEMNQLDLYVADAVLGVDTLWGGDVMCPSGTGRFIADSWFSDEPLPAAYTHPAASVLHQSGGVSGKNIDRAAVETYLREVDLPAAIAGLRREAANLAELRRAYLMGLAVSLDVMWDLAMEVF